MVINGKQLADDIVQKLKRTQALQRIAGKTVAVLVVDETEEIAAFVRQKQRVGDALGLQVVVRAYAKTISLSDIVSEIQMLNVNPSVAGIIVQLPLPEHLDARQVFNAIVISKDSDALSDAAFGQFHSGVSLIPSYQKTTGEEPRTTSSCIRGLVAPPVAAAISHIMEYINMDIKDKFATVLGAGRLVGMPVLSLFARMGIPACSFQDWSETVPEFLRRADIIVSGIGRPGVITGDMIKQGAVVFDVGYGFTNGKVCGDVDFVSVQPKASVMTPVPGGIGPLTVAMLFRNIVELNK